jgi:uncharacterized membrane protein
MATHTSAEHPAHASRTTPKDFFLWFGAILALYGTVTAFFALIFDYINIAFPDPLAYYGDPFGTSVRLSMATLIVLVPVMLGCLLTIRRDIVKNPGKANIWVRKWSLVLTIFLASATAAVTLITLINTFLGGEITMRFTLKALVVLLTAVLTALHFLADFKGYWTLHRQKVNMVGAGIGALAIMTVIGGFLIIGSPSHIRDLRTDQQRVNDLSNLQYSIASYWQQKRTLPKSLSDLNDPLVGMKVPADPITGQSYEYTPNTNTSFTICATFNADSVDTKGQGSYPSVTSYPSMPYSVEDTSFEHGIGRTCFTRTIDPDKYPPLQTAKPL